MPNLSQIKRERMMAFLQKIKDEHRDDDEMLIALGEIESELNAKKYGLVWEQHEEAVDVMMQDNIPVFTEVAEKEIIEAPGDGFNFILEGDNLHSLRLLEKTHKGKIDVIYIDPPYNTGNKDFRYDDKYVDAVDGYRHSKWLSFIAARLQYAYRLLSETGSILISINDIIDAFSAKNIIRVSATAIENKRYEYFEIDEVDVIGEGLITKALYVNEGLADGMEVADDYDCLLDLADSKRKDIAARYKELGKAIRPLVLIQFPNGQPETIRAVEKKLESMGYTYDNGMVSIWMSEDKRDLPDNLTENDATPVFLLMKQAISTGWDCPRAKILVKLREGMSESFEIQTIGRIRRMPEAKHYEDDLLDFCYVYTFDEKYKAGLMSSIDKAYETRRLFLKDKCKTFTIEKQVRDLDFDGLGEREVLIKIHEALVKKYNLGSDKKMNKMLLSDAGYVFGTDIHGQALQGEFVRTSALADSHSYITTHKRVDTHKHGIQLMHSIDAIKSSIGMAQNKVKTILERLFRKGGNPSKKLIALETPEFYAFVINNQHKLKEEFRAVTAQMAVQLTMTLQPKKSPFRIPEQDFFKYDPGVKNEVEYLSNAYHEYTSGFATSVVRSTCEMLFEQHCEGRDDIEWVYSRRG